MQSHDSGLTVIWLPTTSPSRHAVVPYYGMRSHDRDLVLCARHAVVPHCGTVPWWEFSGTLVPVVGSKLLINWVCPPWNSSSPLMGFGPSAISYLIHTDLAVVGVVAVLCDRIFTLGKYTCCRGALLTIPNFCVN